MQQGMQEGRHEALLELVLPMLEQRFGGVDEAVRARVLAASAAELQRWIRNIPHAGQLEDVFRLQ